MKTLSLTKTTLSYNSFRCIILSLKCNKELQKTIPLFSLQWVQSLRSLVLGGSVFKAPNLSFPSIRPPASLVSLLLFTRCCMSVSKAFSLLRWPQGGSTTMNKFLSSCHSLNSKPKKNRLPLINVSSVKSWWNAVKLKDVTNFESYWNLKYTLNHILQVKQKCKNKTKQLGRCLSCKEFCSWAFGSVLFLSVLFMSGDIFWNEGISPLRQESTFFFLKASFQTTAQLPRFTCGVFWLPWNLAEMWDTLAVWRLEPVRPLAAVKFELTGGFVLCLLSLCASGCVALL